MNFRIERKYYKKDYIIGDLYIDDVFFCNTLEPVSEYLLKPGVYMVSLNTHSALFANHYFYKAVTHGYVPCFVGYPERYFSKDRLNGSIMVGFNKIKGTLIETAATFMELYEKMKISYHKEGNLYIEIKE